jgi:hypothetical protein
MTPEQLVALKADILANSDLNAQPNNSDGAFEIARLYNMVASPDFIVWKTSVSLRDIMSNGFRWTDVDGLTAAKYRTWELMNSIGNIDPSKPNVRQGIRDCWGNGSQQEVAILPHLKRQATRGEKLFSVGTGTTNSPATMSFEGTISYSDVEEARNLS